MGHRKAKAFPPTKAGKGGSRFAAGVQREDEPMDITSNPAGPGPDPLLRARFLLRSEQRVGIAMPSVALRELWSHRSFR